MLTTYGNYRNAIVYFFFYVKSLILTRVNVWVESFIPNTLVKKYEKDRIISWIPVTGSALTGLMLSISAYVFNHDIMLVGSVKNF